MTYLAEIPSGNAMMGWMGCAAFLMVFLKQAIWLRDRAVGQSNGVSIDDQPVGVRLTSGMISEKDFDAKSASMQRQIDEVRAERKEDVNALHDKVNGVALEVSAVKKAVEFIEARVMHVDAKLDRMIERETVRDNKRA